MRRYIKGQGLEIGALGNPLSVPRNARVRYVDRFDRDGLIEQYPDSSPELLVPVDIVDDGQTLSTQAAGSADFIIANHLIEHTENPLATLENFARVLRPGGILYMAVPDRHRTFDVDRPPTTIEHIARDYDEGPSWSRQSHLEEWATLVERAPADKVATRVRQLDEINYAVHFHVWDAGEFRALLDYARRRIDLPFQIKAILQRTEEFVAVLQRT